MILRRLLPRTFGVLGMIHTWRAMVDDPVLLCACQDGDWCDFCEPDQVHDPYGANSPQLRSAA